MVGMALLKNHVHPDNHVNPVKLNYRIDMIYMMNTKLCNWI